MLQDLLGTFHPALRRTESLPEMQRIIFNDYVDVVLAGLFMFVMLSIAVFGVVTVLCARRESRPTVREMPFEAMPSGAAAAVRSGH